MVTQVISALVLPDLEQIRLELRDSKEWVGMMGSMECEVGGWLEEEKIGGACGLKAIFIFGVAWPINELSKVEYDVYHPVVDVE